MCLRSQAQMSLMALVNCKGTTRTDQKSCQKSSPLIISKRKIFLWDFFLFEANFSFRGDKLVGSSSVCWYVAVEIQLWRFKGSHSTEMISSLESRYLDRLLWSSCRYSSTWSCIFLTGSSSLKMVGREDQACMSVFSPVPLFRVSAGPCFPRLSVWHFGMCPTFS